MARDDLNKRLASCALCIVTGLAQAQDAALMPGRWSASGRFFEVKVHEKCGLIPFDLRIDGQRTLTGSIGRAKIAPATPKVSKNRTDYDATLDVQPCPEGENSKKSLVLLITETSPDTFRGDFHLKASFGFDFSMHPGRVEGQRVE